jgi:hypothetical protein
MDIRRIRELRTMPYEGYLQTDEWAQKREQVLKRDNYRCKTCNTREHLQVHHWTYARRGNEPLNDLTTLCQFCHETVHRRKKQEEIMRQTYVEPSSPKRQRRAGVQQFEDDIIGFLLCDPTLSSYVCGILSEGDFTEPDTREIYRLLLSGTLDIPDLLTGTVSRVMESLQWYVLHEKSRDFLIKAIVQYAACLKRYALLRLNTDLSYVIGSATSEPQLRQKLQDMYCRLRTLNTAMEE